MPELRQAESGLGACEQLFQPEAPGCPVSRAQSGGHLISGSQKGGDQSSLHLVNGFGRQSLGRLRSGGAVPLLRGAALPAHPEISVVTGFFEDGGEAEFNTGSADQVAARRSTGWG